MINVPVIWKNYVKETKDGKVANRGYWDQNLLEEVFSKELWNPVNGYDFTHYNDFDEDFKDRYITSMNNGVASYDGAIVILPARYLYDYVDQINEDINALKWCLLIIGGDEEGKFPVNQIKHPNCKIWLMTPHIENDNSNVDRFIGEGYPPKAHSEFKKYTKAGLNKELNWFFAGQVTHKRREECMNQLRGLPNGELIETAGFTQGLSQKEYYKLMVKAKVVPCPSGPETPDTFRFYEALESGAVPITDAISTKHSELGYWNLLFGDNLPFPLIEDWDDSIGDIQYHADVFPHTNNKVFAWWQNYKRQFSYNMRDDLFTLTKVEAKTNSLKDKITILIPTSPILAHPDTSIIEETISTVRFHFPESEIIIMFDGIRQEHEDRRPAYNEYIKRMLWKCNYEYKNVLPMVFDQHTHQAGMTKEALKLVHTPTIMFVEHDTPVTPDLPLEAEGVINTIELGYADLVRYHFESHILDVHKPLMLDNEPQIICGVPMTRTIQWSQRPHIASTEFYRNILDRYFSVNALTMIEDRIHGIVAESYKLQQKVGWNQFKLWIYTPEGNIKRSYHLDARKSDPKYDESFVY